MKHLSMDIRVPIELDNPSIFRNEELCIKCGQCRDVCRDYIGVHGTYSLKNTGNIAVCINCGQCANVCPVSSITEKYEYPDVKKAILDPEAIVIFNTSPSVRIALGEEFGMADGSFVEGKMVALLHHKISNGNQILKGIFLLHISKIGFGKERCVIQNGAIQGHHHAHNDKSPSKEFIKAFHNLTKFLNK